MRIVYATAELSPYASAGGLGEVAAGLPRALRAAGHEVAVFTPFHRAAKLYCEARSIVLEPVLETTLEWSHWTQDFTVLRAQVPDEEIYFVANPGYFDRTGIYASPLEGPDDQVQRFAFFCRAIVRACEHLGQPIDILHANDWHTALLPFYLATGLRFSHVFSNSSSILTIHNIQHQGTGPATLADCCGIHTDFLGIDGFEFHRGINVLKGGVVFADAVTTVSPQYAKEIATAEHGAGLDGVIRALKKPLTGILNGIDTDDWNPATDPTLTRGFSAGNIFGRRECRDALRTEAELESRPKSPIIAMVTRIAQQKGVHLLVPIIERVSRLGAQIVILGDGDDAIAGELARLAVTLRGSFRYWPDYRPNRARRIFAGSDLVLMPSLSEPCGLTQLYAMRYGAIPVVRLTGGLVDTVVPFDGTNLEEAQGFAFAAADSESLYRTIWLAVLNLRREKIRPRLQENAMTRDSSWTASVSRYLDIYQQAANQWKPHL